MDRLFLEEFVVRGFPPSLRRKLWMSATGVYGYLKNYQDGYYQTISSENNEIAYPTWPHPDYQQIEKDIKRTFSDEDFFRLDENQDKLRRILRAYVRRNPV